MASITKDISYAPLRDSKQLIPGAQIKTKLDGSEEHNIWLSGKIKSSMFKLSTGYWEILIRRDDNKSDWYSYINSANQHLVRILEKEWD